MFIVVSAPRSTNISHKFDETQTYNEDTSLKLAKRLKQESLEERPDNIIIDDKMSSHAARSAVVNQRNKDDTTKRLPSIEMARAYHWRDSKENIIRYKLAIFYM